MRTIGTITVTVAAFPVSAVAQGGAGMPEWMWWWGPWHMLMPLLFFGLLIFGGIALVRWLWPSGSGGLAESRRALDLLDERYARGDIDREEYQLRRKDLTGR